MNEKKFALAETELGEALGILRKQGANHPTVAIGESWLAKVYTQQGRYREAKTMLEHALPILEMTWPDGYLLADGLYELAQVERLEKDYAAAELGYRKAIVAYEKAGARDRRALRWRCASMPVCSGPIGAMRRRLWRDARRACGRVCRRSDRAWSTAAGRVILSHASAASALVDDNDRNFCAASCSLNRKYNSEHSDLGALPGQSRRLSRFR